MKDVFDGDTKGEKEQDQFVKFAKVKSWHSCGQGTEHQQEEKDEVIERLIKDKKKWLWKESTFKAKVKSKRKA